MKHTRMLTRLVILISLTLAIELVGLPQPITGPLVNLMLILTALLLNTSAGIALGAITPLMAVMRGQLPPVLAPMVPFVILSNAVLVVLFMHLSGLRIQSDSLPRMRIWLALAVAALGKTALLFTAASLILPLVFGHDLPEAALAAMSLPQLVTALIGGGIAVGIYPALRRVLNNKR